MTKHAKPIEPNTVIAGDCIEFLEQLLLPQADLIFADPPFNIGYTYDRYNDTREYEDYCAWTERWMTACANVLKPTGSFWVAIGDDYAAEVRLIGRKLGLNLRNWVIWHYTFGQATKAKFARSHTHLFYWTKDDKEFTFNDTAVRTFSDRQRVYNDKRANKAGKIPDDVWAEFPRVCGTFGEREGWNPCQMPETVLARIVRVSSNPGDMVLDPFAGSGTTLAVAKKLARDYLGVELSEDYVREIRKRLARTEPMAPIRGEKGDAWPEEHVDVLKGTYMEAGVSTEWLFNNRPMLDAFVQQFNHRLEHSGVSAADGKGYRPSEVWAKLEQFRKGAKLGKIRVHATEPKKPAVRSLT